MSQARERGWFVGVDPQRYPRDFATFARYHVALTQSAERIPLPAPLDLADLDAFLAETAGHCDVRWIEDHQGALATASGA